MTEEQDRKTQIIAAAFEEFATKGFRGATIKSIAERAGLASPTLIYWYFPTKEDLFQAVLETHSPLLQATVDADPLLDIPPETVLPMLAQAYFAVFYQPTERQMIRLMLAEAIQRPEIVNLIGERFAGRVFDFLKAYLARQVELGRLRPHDTRASARAFIGSLIPQAMGLFLVPALLKDGLTTEQHINTVVELFLRGLKADPHVP